MSLFEGRLNLNSSEGNFAGESSCCRICYIGKPCQQIILSQLKLGSFPALNQGARLEKEKNGLFRSSIIERVSPRNSPSYIGAHINILLNPFKYFVDKEKEPNIIGQNSPISAIYRLLSLNNIESTINGELIYKRPHSENINFRIELTLKKEILV